MTSDETASAPEPHSAHWLKQDFRDAWWDRDQLELIASRLELSAVEQMLDVGCGIGHWSFLLAAVLDPNARFTGVDREPRWIAKATSRAVERELAGRMRFEHGDVGELPFEDESFDLVTCQTVLMHLADPRAAIAEMLRVTRPGGLVLAAELNNRVAWLLDHSVSAGASIEDRIDLIRFGLICERGKASLGEGDEAIGSLVPGYFAQAGMMDVQAVISQRTPVLYPPYATEQQQVLLGYVLNPETWIGSAAMRRRYFLAGGGTESEFEAAYGRRLREHDQVVEAIRAGTFHLTGGFNLFLTWGRRPG